MDLIMLRAWKCVVCPSADYAKETATHKAIEVASRTLEVRVVWMELIVFATRLVWFTYASVGRWSNNEYSLFFPYRNIWQDVNIGNTWTKLVQGGLVQAGFGKRADLIIAADTVVELDVICSFLATWGLHNYCWNMKLISCEE